MEGDWWAVEEEGAGEIEIEGEESKMFGLHL